MQTPTASAMRGSTNARRSGPAASSRACARSMSPGRSCSYSGETMEVVDGLSGELRSMQIFVAALGASNYTYAEASFSQSLPDWIASHVRAFAYFGGVARQTVSDNLKAGITRGSLSRPDGQPDVCRSRPPLPHRHRSRRDRIVHATKPRSKSGSKSSDDGFSRVCATADSCPSPPSTRRSTRSWSS